jgi:hypothetical protein
LQPAETDWLKDDGFAKITRADGDTATDFAKIPAILDEVLILFGVADLKAEIVQIAEVLVVACMRHTKFCHSAYLPEIIKPYLIRVYSYRQDSRMLKKVQVKHFIKNDFRFITTKGTENHEGFLTQRTNLADSG